jgi:hypothetical protein
VDLIAMLNDVKSHFEHGGQLAESHLPSLLHVGSVIAGDPFVQAAINTALSPEGKVLVTDLMGRLEALEQAHAAAVPPAEVPAEVPADGAPPA